MAQDRALPNHWSQTPLARVLKPVQDFIHSSSAGGLVLMAAAVVAMLIANSPWATAYDDLLHSYIAVSVGPFEVRENVLHWINDGLMAVFFLLVGLEIKREVLVGELASPRAAALPIVAAIGGALVPALIYFAFNRSGPAAAGWGIPMATDIAFALGVLALLGSRIPFALKIFLTAVAIVDDLIAVLVIALFYSGGLNFVALTSAFVLLFVLMLANIFGIRSLWFYLGVGLLIWLAFLQSGIHATLAGVLIALTIPARYSINDRTFLERGQALLQEFEASESEATAMLTDERQQGAVLALEELCEQVQAPLQKLEHELHLPVNFLILPIFALANAGVPLSADALNAEAMPVVLGIALGLLVGKPVGLLAFVWLAKQAGWVSLPPGIGWGAMAGVGVLAGIGFTMSLFIATLGFGDGALLDSAKLGILIASLIAGLTGYALLLRLPARAPA